MSIFRRRTVKFIKEQWKELEAYQYELRSILGAGKLPMRSVVFYKAYNVKLLSDMTKITGKYHAQAGKKIKGGMKK